MKKNNKTTRKQFLKNTVFSALLLSVFPSFLKANGKALEEEEAPPPNCEETTLDYYGQGPFYTANAPAIKNDMLANSIEVGTRIIISGRVMNLDCSEFISNTEIDVWHANDKGDYDNDGFNLRGKTYSNAQGFYIFETVKPGHYLNGANYRPSHIHFKIVPPGFSPLTTQLYFENDPYISIDAAASLSSGIYNATSRIIKLITNVDGDLEGTWDIVVNGDGEPLGGGNLHLDKGIIYKVGPNPFSDKIEIYYGVFAHSKVSLLVYDMLGKQVADLAEEVLSPEKYTAVWQPNSSLANGHYFIALKINDLQVHYTKVVLQR